MKPEDDMTPGQHEAQLWSFTASYLHQFGCSWFKKKRITLNSGFDDPSI